MTNQTTIPAGYRLSITSWENDGDHRQTKVLASLTAARVRFIIELCKLFRSHHQSKDCFGNLYDPTTHEIHQAHGAIARVFQKHRSALTDDELELLESQDGSEGCVDYVSEFIGQGEGDVTFRVFEKAVVESVPAATVIENVSAEFGV